MIEAGARILRDVFDAEWSASESFARQIFDGMSAAASSDAFQLSPFPPSPLKATPDESSPRTRDR
jgi:hypothetical protein